MISADYFCSVNGYALPLQTARFVQAGKEFILEDPADTEGQFAALRIPRRIVIAGQSHR